MDELSPGARALYEILMSETNEEYEARFLDYRKGILNSIKSVRSTDGFQAPATATSSPTSAVAISTAASDRAAPSSQVPAAPLLDSTASQHAPSSSAKDSLAPEARLVHDCLDGDSAATALEVVDVNEKGATSLSPATPLHHRARVSSAVATASSATSSAATSPTTSAGSRHVHGLKGDTTVDGLSPDARRIFDYLVGASMDLDPIHDAVEIGSADLAVLAPTTCSPECTSRDATVSVAAVTPSATPSSAPTTGIAIPGLAAPVVSDDALDVHETSVAAVPPIPCSTDCLGSDFSASFLAPLPTFTPQSKPPPTAAATLGPAFTMQVEMSSSTSALADHNLEADVFWVRHNMISTYPVHSEALIAKQHKQVLRPIPWPSFKYHSEGVYAEEPCSEPEVPWQRKHLQQWCPPDGSSLLKLGPNGQFSSEEEFSKINMQFWAKGTTQFQSGLPPPSVPACDTWFYSWLELSLFGPDFSLDALFGILITETCLKHLWCLYQNQEFITTETLMGKVQLMRITVLWQAKRKWKYREKIKVLQLGQFRMATFADGPNVCIFLLHSLLITCSQNELPSSTTIETLCHLLVEIVELKPWPSWQLSLCIVDMISCLHRAFHNWTSLVLTLKIIYSQSTHYLEVHMFGRVTSSQLPAELFLIEQWVWAWDPGDILVQRLLSRTRPRYPIQLDDNSEYYQIANYAFIAITCLLHDGFDQDWVLSSSVGHLIKNISERIRQILEYSGLTWQYCSYKGHPSKNYTHDLPVSFIWYIAWSLMEVSCGDLHFGGTRSHIRQFSVKVRELQPTKIRWYSLLLAKPSNNNDKCSLILWAISHNSLRGNPHYYELMQWSLNHSHLRSEFWFYTLGHIIFCCYALMQWKIPWIIHLLSWTPCFHCCRAEFEPMYSSENFQWTIAWSPSSRFSLSSLHPRTACSILKILLGLDYLHHFQAKFPWMTFVSAIMSIVPAIKQFHKVMAVGPSCINVHFRSLFNISDAAVYSPVHAERKGWFQFGPAGNILWNSCPHATMKSNWLRLQPVGAHWTFRYVFWYSWDVTSTIESETSSKNISATGINWHFTELPFSHLTWDPGGSTQHRLEGKPKLRRGDCQRPALRSTLGLTHGLQRLGLACLSTSPATTNRKEDGQKQGGLEKNELDGGFGRGLAWPVCVACVAWLLSSCSELHLLLHCFSGSKLLS